MFRRRASLLVALFLVYCAGVTRASVRSTESSNPPQAMNFTVEGKISRLSQNRFTLNTEENIIFHVRYDEKTEIKRQDGSPASPKDLRVGLRVRVDGDLTESGEIVAYRLELQQEPPKKSPK